MTFTTQIKEEITKDFQNVPEELTAVCTYLHFNSAIQNDTLSVTIINASVARWVFKNLKEIYNIDIKLTTRTMKRFKVRNLYILEIKEKLDTIIADIKGTLENIITESDEEKRAFLKGVFLSCGSINDPKKNQYHLEFLVKEEKDANIINDVLLSLKLKSKILKREREYMIYIKSSENIADFIKSLGAVNSLFYFEDIRIYKDHKNMVNRLNNCEQANMEKTLKSSKIVLDNIKYLEDNDLFNLLDDKSKEILNYKKKYPDTSLGQLAEIISLETGKSITKSGINHHMRKLNELVSKHQNKK